MKFFVIIAIICVPVFGFTQNQPFDEQTPPPAPDYALGENWSALPFRDDAADAFPKQEDWVSDSLKEVDVFYVHPTMYLKGKQWNADVTDKRMNKKVDTKPVHFQASVFNQTCRVYAPRYRQAVVTVFYEKSEDGEKALELAYSDVKRAFDYYLEHYNQGRPIIIASHSQGTRHSRKLLQEYFDGTELQEKLVTAYMIGFTVNKGMYQTLEMCENATETGCYIAWMSYKQGYEPDGTFHRTTESINPLTWRLDTAFVDASKGLGTVVLNLNKKYTNKTGASIHYKDGHYLWVKSKAPWMGFFKNMHILDYNLFWHDIRKNVKDRVDAYFGAKH